MKRSNKETIRIFIEEAFNKGNTLVLEDIIHPDYSYNSPSESMQGTADLKAFIMALRSAFPDMEIKIEDQLVESQKVCTRIQMTGTHQGDFLGIPATGKKVNLQGVVISEFQDDLIHREWELLDQLTLLQQLGLAATDE